MKEYKSAKIAVDEFDQSVNAEAAQDWRVLSVVPSRYLPAMSASGLQLTEVTVIFERGT
jgi:hypothetical protein